MRGLGWGSAVVLACSTVGMIGISELGNARTMPLQAVGFADGERWRPPWKCVI